MILISVDLPEPLSPSRPRISPLRRCRLTSRSAVVGPKLLEMCSTRSTSSGAEAGARIFSAGSARSAKTGPRAHALDVDVGGHRDQDREPEIEVEVVGADALDDQAVVEHAEEQRADQGADHRAGAAAQERAADHGRGHCLKGDFVGADGSGDACTVRTDSRIPTKPAQVAQRTKLRIITRRTRMPASAEPRRLPPTATV